MLTYSNPWTWFINKTCNKTAKLLWNLSLDCQMDYRDLFHHECFMCAPTAGACSAGLHSQACFGQKDEVTAEQVEKSQMDWLGVSGFSGPADLWLIQRSFICSFLWLCVSPSVYGTAVTHTPAAVTNHSQDVKRLYNLRKHDGCCLSLWHWSSSHWKCRQTSEGKASWQQQVPNTLDRKWWLHCVIQWKRL